MVLMFPVSFRCYLGNTHVWRVLHSKPISSCSLAELWCSWTRLPPRAGFRELDPTGLSSGALRLSPTVVLSLGKQDLAHGTPEVTDPAGPLVPHVCERDS